MFTVYKDNRTDDLIFWSKEQAIIIDPDKSVLHITDPEELLYCRAFILDDKLPIEGIGRSFGPVTFFAYERFIEGIREDLRKLNPVRLVKKLFSYIRDARRMRAIDKIRLVLKYYDIDEHKYSDEDIRELGLSIRELTDNSELNLEVLAEALTTVNREIRKL